jgi:hypothetical protein
MKTARNCIIAAAIAVAISGALIHSAGEFEGRITPLGQRSELDTKPLGTLLRGAPVAKEIAAPLSYRDLDTSAAGLLLCPADGMGECEPVAPFKSGSVRLILPDGREHKSSPSSGSTTAYLGKSAGYKILDEASFSQSFDESRHRCGPAFLHYLL